MSRRPRLAAAAAALAMVSVAAPAAAQFCPSYTASSPSNNNGCAIEAVQGTNPTPAEWADIFDLASRGPAAYGDAGPSVRDINDGCGLPDPFPCELLKAIAMVESAWLQFCVPTTPPDQEGGPSRTIISFDCGYGVGQVTSGMHDGEDPDFDRQLVASDAFYNLATGTRILADKWAATACVGDNRVLTVEHWYAAAWAYNGLAYSNNPNNPNFDSDRGVYDPAVNNAAPYQEKVFGRIENPTGDLWPSVPLAYPDPAAIGGNSSPQQTGEPACAGPTDCVNTRPTHITLCNDDPGTGGAGGGAGGGDTTSGPSTGTLTAGPGPTGSGSGGDGTGGDGGPAGNGPSASGPVGPTGSGGAGGSGATGNGAGDLEGGCDCRAAPAPSRAPGALAALVGLAISLLRRRRTHGPHG
jgi:MYXO-CTERM domain-containing protein